MDYEKSTEEFNDATKRRTLYTLCVPEYRQKDVPFDAWCVNLQVTMKFIDESVKSGVFRFNDINCFLRTIDEQFEFYKNSKRYKDMGVLPVSAHQLGLAVDIQTYGRELKNAQLAKLLKHGFCYEIIDEYNKERAKKDTSYSGWIHAQVRLPRQNPATTVRIIAT